jgi:hypothetical protein
MKESRKMTLIVSPSFRSLLTAFTASTPSQAFAGEVETERQIERDTERVSRAVGGMVETDMINEAKLTRDGLRQHLANEMRVINDEGAMVAQWLRLRHQWFKWMDLSSVQD